MAYEVTGDVGLHYQELGGASSPLGEPLTDSEQRAATAFGNGPPRRERCPLRAGMVQPTTAGEPRVERAPTLSAPGKALGCTTLGHEALVRLGRSG